VVFPRARVSSRHGAAPRRALYINAVSGAKQEFVAGSPQQAGNFFHDGRQRFGFG
jgi:hypothetical protein